MATNKLKVTCGSQLTYNTATGDGTYKNFSALMTELAPVIIFDNQSDVPVTISDNSSIEWKTFAAGGALVLDLRTNKLNIEDDFCWPIGTQWRGKSAAGSGSFLISTIYAR